jgi:hypothetical protein
MKRPNKNSWSYGLVDMAIDEGQGRAIVLCEIYFKKNDTFMICPVDYGELTLEDSKLVLQDLTLQIDNMKSMFYHNGKTTTLKKILKKRTGDRYDPGSLASIVAAFDK